MSLRTMPVLPRLFVLFSALAVLPMLAGAVLWGVKGALVAFLLVDCWLLYLAGNSQETVVRELGGVRAPDPGVRASYRLLLRELGLEESAEDVRRGAPELGIYSDSVPGALVARSMGGPGIILLSEGLVRNVGEEELRAILAFALRQVSESDWVFTTLCAAMAARLLRRAPAGWASLAYSGRETFAGDPPALSRGGFLLFSLMFPVLQLLLKASGPGPRFPSLQLGHRARVVGRPKNPGLAVLFLLDPTRPEQLLPTR